MPQTIEINELEYCKIAVHYETSNLDTINSKRADIIDGMKKYKVPGFRKNRATSDAVKFHFKNEIKNSLMEQLANDALQEVIVEKEITPFGKPQLTSYQLDNDHFVCDFNLFIQPKFELGKYKEFEIPKAHQTMTSDELTQATLQDLRVKNGEITPYTVDDFVQLTDNIIIKYKGYIDDIQVEKLSANNDLVVVGKTPIQGFDDNLLGMKVGDKKQFIVKAPDVGVDDDLKNKDIKFDVELVIGSKITPAPLDDTLAKKMGVENIQLVLEGAKSVADKKIAENEETHYINQISSRLIEAHQFKIPAWLTSVEAQFSAKSNGEVFDTMSDARKEQYVNKAERSVKLALILNKIRSEEPEACLTDEETVNALKQEVSRFASNPEETMKQIYTNGQLPMLLNRLRDDYTMSFIKKTCTIIE